MNVCMYVCVCVLLFIYIYIAFLRRVYCFFLLIGRPVMILRVEIHDPIVICARADICMCVYMYVYMYVCMYRNT
jgi:hypothetical protein